jgi:hypothetical protein
MLFCSSPRSVIVNFALPGKQREQQSLGGLPRGGRPFIYLKELIRTIQREGTESTASLRREAKLA